MKLTFFGNSLIRYLYFYQLYLPFFIIKTVLSIIFVKNDPILTIQRFSYMEKYISEMLEQLILLYLK